MMNSIDIASYDKPLIAEPEEPKQFAYDLPVVPRVVNWPLIARAVRAKPAWRGVR